MNSHSNKDEEEEEKKEGSNHRYTIETTQFAVVPSITKSMASETTKIADGNWVSSSIAVLFFTLYVVMDI